MIRVFVYGSLLSGLGNHRVLGDSERVMDDVTISLSAKMISLGAYPALVMTAGMSEIKGEVYEVTDEVLVDLDRLEGHPNFYKRHLVGDIWVYFLQQEWDKGRIHGQPTVEDGDWRRYHKEATERRKYG